MKYFQKYINYFIAMTNNLSKNTFILIIISSIKNLISVCLIIKYKFKKTKNIFFILMYIKKFYGTYSN